MCSTSIDISDSDDTTMIVDYTIQDGQVIVLKIYPSDKLKDFIQSRLDETTDELIEDSETSTLEFRKDERNDR